VTTCGALSTAMAGTSSCIFLLPVSILLRTFAEPTGGAEGLEHTRKVEYRGVVLRFHFSDRV